MIKMFAALEINLVGFYSHTDVKKTYIRSLANSNYKFYISTIY